VMVVMVDPIVGSGSSRSSTANRASLAAPWRFAVAMERAHGVAIHPTCLDPRLDLGLQPRVSRRAHLDWRRERAATHALVEGGAPKVDTTENVAQCQEGVGAGLVHAP